MFEEIGDTIEDTVKAGKKFLSKKLIAIFGGGVVLILLFLFFKNKNKVNTTTTVVSDNKAVDDYAEVPENADTVISTLENVENYNHRETMAGLESIYNIVTNTGSYNKTGTYRQENADKIDKKSREYQVNGISKIIARDIKSDIAIGKTMHNIIYSDGSTALINNNADGTKKVVAIDKTSGEKFEGVL